MASGSQLFDSPSKQAGNPLWGALPPLKEDPSKGVTLEIVACAPSLWDLAPPPETSSERMTGNVLVGHDPKSGECYCCGGFLPCGVCERCEMGLHLACTSPLRPGWNTPGGCAPVVTLPAPFLVPCTEQADDWASVVALLALAGPLYQAQAQSGMTPGDLVLVLGDLGPGALPLQVLICSGLHPIWISSDEMELPEGAEQITESAEFAALPVTRRHLICLPNADPSFDWSRITASCISCTFIGPAPPAHQPLSSLLDGQVRLQWIKDIHPHLVLDMIAISKRIMVTPWRQRHDLAHFLPAFKALLDEETLRWPVLIP